MARLNVTAYGYAFAAQFRVVQHLDGGITVIDIHMQYAAFVCILFSSKPIIRTYVCINRVCSLAESQQVNVHEIVRIRHTG